MKFRQRISKADGGDGSVASPSSDQPQNRLTGIEVEEVSIVDRGANKRKYLVVKRESKGGVKKEGEPVDKSLPTPPTAGPPAAPAPGAAPPAQPAPPAALRISPELKAQVLAKLTTAQQKIGIIITVLQGSSETPGAPPPQELMDALAQLATMFAPTAPPPAAPVAPPAAAPPPAAPAQKDATAKAGRKISAARLKQLQDMQTSLSTLIDDVSGTVENETEEDSSEAEAEEKPAAAKKQATVASPELQAIQASLSALATTVGTVAKVIEGQNARIETLQKSRGVSRQVETEEREPTTKQAPAVVWDLDMAKPSKEVP